MGIFDALMGNSSEVPAEKIQQDLATLLSPQERVLKGFQLIRDSFILTDKRLIIIDRQGVTGRKSEYMCIPYKSIVRFSVETAGTFDLDAELKIWLASTTEPISYTFNTNVNVYEVQAAMIDAITG